MTKSKRSFASIFLVAVHLISPTIAFQNSQARQVFRGLAPSSTSTIINTAVRDAEDENKGAIDGRISIPSAELDETLGLTGDERTIVNIHRVCSPSVVYITSILKPPSTQQSRRRKTVEDDAKKLPRGTALGSGSGFIVDTTSSGSQYVITNYHVIQRAYEANQMIKNYGEFWNNLGKNVTRAWGNSLEGLVNRTVDSILRERDTLPAQVFVRFGTDGEASSEGSKASYVPCEIVDVVKELDVAVLRIDGGGEKLPSVRALTYGQSSDLLVGQTLLAIGNPFGLDKTITSGLVSALGRSVTGVAGNPIKNCIQTDAAINPGNSGGPLLNLKGEVVGVNTMIISTSGSSAGIGFAVPGDSVRDNTESIIEMDKEKMNQSKNRKGRGWLGVDIALGSLESSLRKRVARIGNEDKIIGAFVTSISPNSPLAKSSSTIEKTTMTGGKIQLGDRIVNFAGSDISNGTDIIKDLKMRVEGEQVTITVESSHGERRIVYVTLAKMPIA